MARDGHSVAVPQVVIFGTLFVISLGMTGYLAREELHQDIKVDEFLLKPFSLETIATAINNIIPITATQGNDGSNASRYRPLL